MPPLTAPALPPIAVPAHMPITAPAGMLNPNVKTAGATPAAAPARVPAAPSIAPPTTAPAAADEVVTPTSIAVANVYTLDAFVFAISAAARELCFTLSAYFV